MKHCHPLTRRQRATRKQSALNRLPLIASYGVSRSLLFALIIVAALVPVVPVTTHAQEEKRTTSARERFIPAEELDSIFERSPAGVILPRDQFS